MTVLEKPTTVSEELERLKKSCVDMTQTLKALEREEVLLQRQNEILAREAILSGYQPHVIEPTAPKRRRAPPKQKEMVAPAAATTATGAITGATSSGGKF